MNQENEEIQDPKDQAQPPSYRPSNPNQVMRPTNQKMKMGQSTLIPIGEPILDTMGKPMQIQHGTVLQPKVGEGSPAVIPAVVGNQMGPEPASMTCVSCQEVIVTRVEAKANVKTHMFAVMFGVLCLWPCVLLPYYLDCCRNSDHYCSNCGAYIGSYVR